jgi:hypothetical protein
VVDNYGSSDEADFVGGDIVTSFVPEVVDVTDEQIIVPKFLERLRGGLPVLR